MKCSVLSYTVRASKENERTPHSYACFISLLGGLTLYTHWEELDPESVNFVYETCHGAATLLIALVGSVHVGTGNAFSRCHIHCSCIHLSVFIC